METVAIVEFVDRVRKVMQVIAVAANSSKASTPYRCFHHPSPHLPPSPRSSIDGVGVVALAEIFDETVDRFGGCQIIIPDIPCVLAPALSAPPRSVCCTIPLRCESLEVLVLGSGVSNSRHIIALASSRRSGHTREVIVSTALADSDGAKRASKRWIAVAASMRWCAHTCRPASRAKLSFFDRRYRLHRGARRRTVQVATRTGPLSIRWSLSRPPAGTSLWMHGGIAVSELGG